MRVVGQIVMALVAVAVIALVLRQFVRRANGPTTSSAHDGEAADGAGWTLLGSDPTLLDRLGLGGQTASEPVEATKVRVRTLESFPVLAAQTPTRVWANDRSDGGWHTTVTVSGGRYTLCALTLRGTLPSFNLLTEGRLGRIASAVGLPDVDTESGQFNDERRVVADDDRWAHALLAPNVVALLQDGPPDATLQTAGDQLVSFRRGALDPAEVDARLAWMVRVARAIPDFVYDGRY